ncbi:MAG: amino acid permease [Bacteroidetes bacterium]|jgi:amino acid transporter|nr:amino acid permease [Bacteroidota bacterium]MDF2451025.1 amino acid permease [Bacteroidota bacterium]
MGFIFNNLLRRKSVSAISDAESHESGLHRVLTVRDLTFFGIAAIIGAGSFSSIGSACFSGGPAVIFLFVICAIACGFTAMCYADFATRVPASGSAYTYAYVSFGELAAWIIGWALLMEYSIGNIYVAFSWSGYFVNLLEGFGLHMPLWLTNNYSDSHQAFLDGAAGKLSNAWNAAPVVLGVKFIIDLPAIMINILVTWLVYVGTKESRNASNIMVIIKLAIILLVIIVGASYVDIDNWTPFMPNQFSGVMAGVSGVFFAYIGFDAVSTLAEESKNPQRDLPRGMIYSLIICTVVFIILALVLTGMVSYTALNVSDPLAEVFALKGIKWMLFIVSIAAVVAMTSVILVFQMGQPRIWMAMSRDGLLPKKFAEIHPKYKTPAFSTLITGLVVGIPIFFTTPKFVLDFTSIGTLFAFVLVCGGVLILPRNMEAREKGKFKMPYVSSKFIVPVVTVVGFILIGFYYPNSIYANDANDIYNYPMIIFYLVWILIAIFSFIKSYSLIPVLGLLSCCYLLTGMGWTNWMMFSVWLVIGLVVYLMYGYRKSKLNTA